MAVGIVTQIKNYIIRLITRKVANEVIKAAGGRTSKPSSSRSRRSSSGSSRSAGSRSSSRNRKSFAGDDEYEDFNSEDENSK